MCPAPCDESVWGGGGGGGGGGYVDREGRACTHVCVCVCVDGGGGRQRCARGAGGSKRIGFRRVFRRSLKQQQRRASTLTRARQARESRQVDPVSALARHCRPGCQLPLAPASATAAGSGFCSKLQARLLRPGRTQRWPAPAAARVGLRRRQSLPACPPSFAAPRARGPSASEARLAALETRSSIHSATAGRAAGSEDRSRLEHSAARRKEPSPCSPPRCAC